MTTSKAKAQESLTIQWIVNVKYRGKRYRAGEEAEISPEDRDELIADGVIRGEAQDGNIPE